MDKQERICKCCSTRFSSCMSALPPATSSLFLPVFAIFSLSPWEPCGLCLCSDGDLPLCPLDGWLNFAYLLLLFQSPILSCSYFNCIFEVHQSVFLWNYFFCVCVVGGVCMCACVPVCQGHHLEVSFHFLPCLRQSLIHGVLSLTPTLLLSLVC